MSVRFSQDATLSRLFEPFFETKINYIHMNPVRAGIVETEEEYLLSSVGDFHDTRKSYLELSGFG